MPYCSNCGYEYTAGITVCPDCGSRLEEGNLLRCDRCGEQVDPLDLFCGHCGAVQPIAAASAKPPICSLHPGRPAVATCVMCRTILCEECERVRNGRSFCDNDEHLKSAFNWVVACTVGTEQEAEMIKANLESAGIAVTVLSQRDRMNVTTTGDLAVVEVMVPSESLDEALAYLESLESGEPPANSLS
jgi:hypothetical protein